jgi:hypothetical protein
LHQKLEDSFYKHLHEHESSIKMLLYKSNKKYQQVRMNMVSISQMLHDARSMWQGQHAELNLMSKNCLSKEWARQHNAVQQQLDKSSAMEDQL